MESELMAKEEKNGNERCQANREDAETVNTEAVFAMQSTVYQHLDAEQ